MTYARTNLTATSGRTPVSGTPLQSRPQRLLTVAWMLLRGQ